jgi:hypothetical protein
MYRTCARYTSLVDCGVEFAFENANYPKEPGSQMELTRSIRSAFESNESSTLVSGPKGGREGREREL